MVNVETSITINTPVIDVAEFSANPSNVPAWYINIFSVEWQSAEETKVGAKIAFKAMFMGKELSYTYEIVEYEPGIRLLMSTSEGPFPMSTEYQWHSISDNETRMTLRNFGHPKGFSKWMAPLMSVMMRKANTKDLAALKKVLEAK